MSELCNAVDNNDLERVEELIVDGHNVDEFNGRPLLWAIEDSRKEIVEVLIKAGAEINNERHLRTAATGYCKHGKYPERQLDDYKITKLLLVAGAKPYDRLFRELKMWESVGNTVIELLRSYSTGSSGDVCPKCSCPGEMIRMACVCKKCNHTIWGC